MSKASKLVADALLGEDSVTVVVRGKTYFIDSPTIEHIVKAAKYLDSVEGGETVGEMIQLIKSLDNACCALSIFIQGDESLAEELSKGTPKEIADGLHAAITLLSIRDFVTLSTLARSVARMIANPRP